MSEKPKKKYVYDNLEDLRISNVPKSKKRELRNVSKWEGMTMSEFVKSMVSQKLATYPEHKRLTSPDDLG